MQRFSFSLWNAPFLMFARSRASTTSSSGTVAATPGAKGTIGLSVLTLTNPFFKEIVDVMTAERQEGYAVLAVSGDLDPRSNRTK